MCVYLCITKWLSFMWFVQTTFGHEKRERENESLSAFRMCTCDVNVGEKEWEWEQCGNSRRLSAIITRPTYCESDAGRDLLALVSERIIHLVSLYTTSSVFNCSSLIH